LRLPLTPGLRVAAKLSLRLTVLRRSKLNRFPFIDGDVADDADAVQQDGADSRHEPTPNFEGGGAASTYFGDPAALFGRLVRDLRSYLPAAYRSFATFAAVLSRRGNRGSEANRQHNRCRENEETRHRVFFATQPRPPRIS
jgi:hypothetical protein